MKYFCSNTIFQQAPCYRDVLLVTAFLFLCFTGFAQAPQLKFLHLNTEHGLPDGTVRSVTQDKYGYIWLGTQYGLCRYDGYRLTSFFHNKTDTGSLAGNFIWSGFTDRAGDVWTGNDRYLSKYRYDKNDFINYACPFNAAVSKIAEDEAGKLWLATSGGLMRFDKQTGHFIHYREHTNATVRKACSVRINDLYLDKEKGLIYLATHSGFKVFDYHNENILPPFVNSNYDPYGINETIITTVTKDKKGLVWFGCGFINTVLARWDPATNAIQYYHDFTDKSRGWLENRIISLFTDRDGNIWAGGLTSSLSLYLPGKDYFHHYQNDALLKSSIAGTNISAIYQDGAGMIWVGSEGYGVDRFHPENTMFTSFQPQAAVQPSLLHDWGRAAIEDSRGNIWFGTSKGISVYDPAKTLYQNYFNNEKNPAQLSFNSIRSFAEDKKGNIWIGTGNGLNRFDPATGHFRIYNYADSLKSYFVWSLLVTNNGELYVGGTGGLQRYDNGLDQFRDVVDDPVINKKFRFNVRNLFEDSRQGYWIGFYDGGLVYYNPAQKKLQQYRHSEKDTNTLCNDFVTSVAEDKKGIIWIATRDGLNSLDTKTQRFRLFTTARGLPSNKTSGLRVDASNRLWIATGNGLSVLDPERKFFRNFDMSDGLPINEFNDQTAAGTRDGKLIYPTFRGFIMFNPVTVMKKKLRSPQVYVSAIKVFNKPLSLYTNAEEIKNLTLRYHQNFFSLELTGLNYENPEKITYAYKLEPFNKEWVYTKERNITYTNIPGRQYKFFYKATTDPSDWNVPVHEIDIYVGTVFYKTTWFMLLVIVLIAGGVYGIYSYRLRQTRSLHRLQLQATRLEKDKTEIQYQNLINQFNPHFLFNSLTSLNSLIYENRELASEFLEQLSAVYRYLLTHKETQLVTLESETEFVKHYISLLKTRFEKGLNVTIDIPANLLSKKIVPVTFQLLIENALKHNIVDEASPLHIVFTADERYLYVTNNLQKKGFVETSNRKGLESLQTLYKYLSSLPLLIDQNPAEFIIRVPLI
ncbi:MAG: histidine kinase [Ferruginibacter sp.]|nr:histidine kinase [Ferruginibacter sp.]